MGCLAQAVSPCFDALKLCFETQFICLQLEDVPIFIPDLNSFSVSNPIFLFVIVRKMACFYLLWVYSSCRWFKNERRLERNWRASCLLQDSCTWVSTRSRPRFLSRQKSLGSLKHGLAPMFAEPWLCRKRKARGRMFFTLLSSPRRLRLSSWVRCPATDLEIKPLFVCIMLSLPVLSIISGAVLWLCLCYRARDLLTAHVALDCQTWMWAIVCPS